MLKDTIRYWSFRVGSPPLSSTDITMKTVKKLPQEEAFHRSNIEEFVAPLEAGRARKHQRNLPLPAPASTPTPWRSPSTAT